MAEEILEKILATELKSVAEFPKWFMSLFENEPKCSLERFAEYFLTLIRTQTEAFTKLPPSTCDTSSAAIAAGEPTHPVVKENTGSGGKQDTGGNRSQKSNKSISRDLFSSVTSAVEKVKDFHTNFRQIDADTKSTANVTVLVQTYETSKHEKRTSPTIDDAPFSPIPSSPFSSSSSTPVRHNTNSSQRSGRGSQNSSFNQNRTSTPSNQKVTPKNGSRHDSRRSHDRSVDGNNNSLCLGDFITHSTTKGKSRKSASANSSQNTSNNADKLLLADEFPELRSSTPSNDVKSKKRVTPITVSKTLPSRLSAGGSSFELDNSLSPIVTEGKAKRRVTPTILSKSFSTRHDFTRSSFGSDNNLVNLTKHSLELDQPQKDERGLLRNYKDIIKCSFEAVELRDTTNKMLEVAPQPVKIELDRVTKRALIDRLVDIYTVLLDLNMTPSILSELAYLISLINTEVEPAQEEIDPANPIHLAGTILKNINNCVYFALQALHRQRFLLALLDSVTLKVLIENERISSLDQSLSSYLREVYAQKLQLVNNIPKPLDVLSGGINVFYQQEADTREHFPSDREFGGFRKQRDVFCSVYRSWDLEHLNPAWNFLTEFGGKIRSLLNIMEHPINMAHLAKLFTAQLVQSCIFDNSASELATALPNVDPTKLMKLRKRLVEPSQFSAQYLFPGSQAFFRDFIIASETNQIFMEQLKAVLIHELLEMNGSTYEVLNITGSENQNDCEYVVRPETMKIMHVLAKFIGYIVSRPFNCDNYRNTTVQDRQIKLRNALLPLFDVKSILLEAIAERKLIITVPWMVQYLAMLDSITLRLTYYKELFGLLNELHLRTSVFDSWSERKLPITPTSKFILRACLGWLFENPNIPEEYYSHREDTHSLQSVDEGLKNNKRINVLEDKANSEGLETFDSLTLTKIYERVQGMWKCDIKSKTIAMPKDDFIAAKNDTVSPNPILESILNAACPFLADFRMTMMPTKQQKTVSRSGHYRHITTQYFEVPTIASNSINDQKKSAYDQHRLVEAFLRSQSLSVRRTVEFVIDRVSSAAIKDFQVTHLLPLKKRTTDRITSLRADTAPQATRDIHKICSTALANINASWDTHIVMMLTERIQEAFDALLPRETLVSVKQTCISLTLERCLTKTNEWRQVHMVELDLFCADIPGDASRAARNDSNKKQPTLVTSLTVRPDCVPHTLTYGKLQAAVHKACSYPEELSSEDIEQFLALALRFLDEQVAAWGMHKTLAYHTLQLALLLVTNRCDLIVPDILRAFTTVWQHPKLTEYCKIPEACVANDPEKKKESHYIFWTLVSNRCIRMMAASQQATPELLFASFAKLINSLVDCNLVSIRQLNEQFVQIYNDNWPQETLGHISRLRDAVLGGAGGNSPIDSFAPE